MATNWVDEILSGATSTGSKTLNLATGNTLSVSNSSSESIFTVTSDTTNGGFTSILGIEGQEAVLFLGADNSDDATDTWEIQADTSGNFKIGNRTSGTGSPSRSNTITNAVTVDSSRNLTVAGDLVVSGGDLTLGSVAYLSDSGGTGTLKNIDALDATTEATIEAAMDTLPNVTSVGTLTTLTVDNVIVNGTTIGHTDDTDLMSLASGALTVNGTITATGNITGTLATAAQTNITSLGTLTTLTVDNIIVNGTTIGHTSDTDLMTLASGALTIAGTIETTGNATVGGDLTVTGGDINLSGEASTITLIDNTTSAFIIGSAGKTNLLTINTDDNAETVEIDADRTSATGLIQGALVLQATGSGITGNTTNSNLAGLYFKGPAFINESGTNTITQHSYIKVDTAGITNLSGTATITNVCLLDLEDNLGTANSCTTNSDKTGNSKTGTIKINVNGTIHHIQLYAN